MDDRDRWISTDRETLSPVLEISTVATSQNGMALKFCDPLAIRDEFVVGAAVQNNGLALQYAHISLRENESICKMALANNPKAIASCQQPYSNPNPKPNPKP